MSQPPAGPGPRPPFNPNIRFEDLHKIPSLATAHGTLMGLVFVVILPLGAVAIRLIRGRAALWVHVCCQLLGWVAMIGGLATGINMAKIIDQLHNNPHTILGTVVVAALLLQPFIGYIHHRQFLAKQQQTAWTHLHVWCGRVLLVLGIINGGLGLQLANASPAYSRAGMITYAVLAGVMGPLLLYIMVWHEFRWGKGHTKDSTEH